MLSNFLPSVSLSELSTAHAAGDLDKLYDLLAQPLHEELFRRESFDFLDDLSIGQQLLLTYDYVRMQVGQGGFIQFLHNGYFGLLPSLIEQLNELGAPEMASTLDDALKVFVLNNDLILKPATVEEFAKLYDELKEFEIIDEKFKEQNEATIKMMLDYAIAHLDEFVATPN